MKSLVEILNEASEVKVPPFVDRFNVGDNCLIFFEWGKGKDHKIMADVIKIVSKKSNRIRTNLEYQYLTDTEHHGTAKQKIQIEHREYKDFNGNIIFRDGTYSQDFIIAPDECAAAWEYVKNNNFQVDFYSIGWGNYHRLGYGATLVELGKPETTPDGKRNYINFTQKSYNEIKKLID